MDKGFIIVLVGLLFISGCNNRSMSDRIRVSDDLQVATGYTIFNLDNRLSFGPEVALSCKEINEDFYLYFSNKPNESVDIFSISNPELKKRISINCDARCNLNEYAGSVIIEQGKIMNIDRFNISSSIIMDWQGEFVSGVKGTGEESHLENIVVGSSNQAIVKEDKIFYSSWPIEFSTQDINIEEHRTLGAYDYKKGLHIPVNVNYPKNYLINSMDYYAGVTTYTTDYGDSVIVSYPQSDSIFLVDVKNQQINRRAINSPHKPTPPYVPENLGGTYHSYAQATLNAGLLYDDKKEIFYLLRLQPNAIKDESILLTKYDLCISKPILIDVLDKNFISLGSIALPKNIYDVYKTFVNDGKLYISKNNLFNPRLKEDKLVFEYFDIEVS